MNCPICGSETVQSLKVIYEMGTSTVDATSSGTVAGFGLGSDSQSGGLFGTTSSTTQGTHQTAAAKKAAPPPKQDLTPFTVAIVLGVSALLLCVYLLSLRSIEISLWCIMIAPVGMILLYWGITAAKKANKWNTEEWPRLHDDWLASFRCLKCGHVFIWLSEKSQ
jgi:hypothetical protein